MRVFKLKEHVVQHTYGEKHKDMKRLGSGEKWIFYMKNVTGEGRCLSSWQSSPRTGEREERGAQRDSSPPRLKVIQPSHPRSTWEIWSEDWRYSCPQKGVRREDSDWRESLTFKQALYPYRVGEDMHNPSKMHMNFPSSNSSRLNSSQWINYEYCMYWIAGGSDWITVKKKQKNKSVILEYHRFVFKMKCPSI